MEFEITNAGVNVIEYGWLQIEVTHEGKTYEIELESEEEPSTGQKANIGYYYADKKSEKIGKKIGLDLEDEETIGELYFQWQNYSNSNFRG